MYTHLYAPVSRAQFDAIVGSLPTKGGERFVRGVGKQRWAEYRGEGGELIANWVQAPQDKRTGIGMVV